MPKKSERQELITEVVDLLAVAVLEQEFDEVLGGHAPVDMWEELFPVDSNVEDLFELLQMILSRRYLSPRENIQRSHEFAGEFFMNLPDDEFKQLTRMTRPAFDRVCREIQTHRVFQNNSTNKQAPVWLQLAVGLDRLGTNGNGASTGRTKFIWGVGRGTLDLYTVRVVIALNDLSDTYVVWPDEEGRRSISRRMAVEGFPGCVGFIDGTTFPLSQKPAIDGECYFDRKHRYSLNAQVVCDDRRRIISFLCGWPGSCADSTVYRAMMLAQDDLKPFFFGHEQYLIADSAYPADIRSNTIVPSYKKNQHGQDNEAFNNCVAHVRVVNEHTIGVLKGRWASLRELRAQLNKRGDVERLLQWITACVVLHNIMVDAGEDWPEEHEVDNNLPANQTGVDDDTFPFRRRVKEYAVAVARQPGGILCVHE